MGLTSDDIVNADIKTGMRGYLVPQVDELLDEVADELDRLNGRIRELEAEREAVRNSLEDQFEVEETLRRTLYQAQRAADQTIDDARNEAERIRTEAMSASAAIIEAARQTADETVEAARAQAERESEEVRARLAAQEARMRATGAELRERLTQLHDLEAETRRLLRGLHQDRLRELESDPVDLPSYDDAAFADDFVARPEPASEPPAVDDAPAAGADVTGEEDSSPDDDAVLVVDDVVDVDVASGDPVGAATSETGPEVAADPASPVGASLHAPPYLSAVNDAIAAIERNQVEDRGIEHDPIDESLLDDLVDPAQEWSQPSPAAEESAPAPPPTTDLFADAPRRRRRSG